MPVAVQVVVPGPAADTFVKSYKIRDASPTSASCFSGHHVHGAESHGSPFVASVSATCEEDVCFVEGGKRSLSL